jgi:hypothetical protein
MKAVLVEDDRLDMQVVSPAAQDAEQLEAAEAVARARPMTR